ncbi:IMPACT family protein [Limoniibacter endophyticus]|uniref:Impact N-terminal domain-containing protein n=1 Tax=Limoniibacter endophyticus TaxID=1565040 RepID=A0A8J3DJ69_9HYPH|nr:YigZ family protein [Limoniibacter endophyticus]GHC73683.1 hypothetical protein GCM10010136_21990 [Limoniibacter endophyticus]
MTERFTLRKPHEARQEIKRSRFATFAAPVADEDTAKAFIAKHSDPSATHNCWAWRLGQAYRFNDDGEPSGTAGKPILQAIDGQSLDHVAVLVIRWFGGILLGSGGLIRAYGGSAALCLREAERIPLVESTAATLDCIFSDLALLQAKLSALPHVAIEAQTFTATGAILYMRIHTAMIETVAALINDMTSGRSQLRCDA